MWDVPRHGHQNDRPCLVPSFCLIRQAAFGPDAGYLATVNGNGTAYVLDVKGILAPAHD